VMDTHGPSVCSELMMSNVLGPNCRQEHRFGDCPQMGQPVCSWLVGRSVCSTDLGAELQGGAMVCECDTRQGNQKSVKSVELGPDCKRAPHVCSGGVSSMVWSLPVVDAGTF
jgi:hypothetical protein